MNILGIADLITTLPVDMLMVKVEIHKDEVGRLITEIFIEPTKREPITLSDVEIGNILMQSLIIRVINDDTGNLLGEFKRLDDVKGKLV